MTVVLVAIATSIATSAIMIWLFVPKADERDYQLFEMSWPEPPSTGYMPVYTDGSTDPLQCDLCDFKASTERGLKIHTTRIHK